ncbi:dihydrofolate reductase [Pararhodonellum marinum]|uniref:dihydrofolate reductase n=1 Tax=Pararhodonellum marinum TaxID=2755358 RepID=UPI001E3E64B2|nr:dihydrofolate reductase [Pararhodonellum marinum]
MSIGKKKELKVSIIVAKAKNNVIGKDNQLIWRLPADLQHFKQTTLGHHILMGRKTFESMGKPLPKRTSIVISRNPDYPVPDGHHLVHGMEEALDLARQKGLEKIFVIGGAQIYKQALPLTDELIVTEVEASPEGDVFFPEMDPEEWKVNERVIHSKDEKNEFDFTIVTYLRKTT